MAYRDQLIVTAAPSGTGKTYVRGVLYIMKIFLPDEEGVLYSNYPHDLDAIKEYFDGKIEPEEIDRRLQRFPAEVLDEWRAGVSGPWEYFSGKDLKGAHIAIDEIHNYASQERHSKEHIDQWKKWLGEIRKRGATVELLTQAQSKIPKVLLDESAYLIRLVDSQSRPDPFFKIELADWYEMCAAYTGIYPAAVWEIKEHRHGKTFKEESKRKWRRDSYYYRFYNSYNDTEDGEAGTGEPPPKMYQKLSFLRLHWWFLKKNFVTIFPRTIGFALVAWLALGGFVTVMHYMMDRMMATAKGVAVEKSESQSGANGLVPDDENLGEWVTIKQRKEAAEELERERARAAELEAFRNEMNQNVAEVKRRGDRIGMLFSDYAVTENGRMVRRGDDLYTYFGLKIIKEIKKDEGNVYFTDGSFTHIGYGTRRLSDKIESITNPTVQKAFDGIGPRGQETRKRSRFTNEEKRLIKLQGSRPTSLFTPIGDVKKIQENHRRRSNVDAARRDTGSN
ncbi:Zonular occludens toxin (Zot) [Gimesia alba]|uniref:Zonular occludens toxin (Zot) n=1 Tax=Gimesia alba TaxID=2527973 RepID=A0A517RE37_9PLAN|nr:zonular occludens toxin domain-containing protein [Gimesia alba]QDT42147.1 Zonular occludens toxin (Zot) [Gimesia alba]